MNKTKRKHYFLLGVGFAVSAFFLWVSLQKVDVHSLGDAFRTINYLLILLCAGALWLGIVLRATRWRVIAGLPNSEHHNYLRATKFGLLANLLFPGRAGEFVRVITLTKVSQSTLSASVASALIDRLVDVFVLLFSASILYFLFPVSAQLGKLLTVLFLLGWIITIAVVIYSKSSGIRDALISKLVSRWLRRWPIQPEIFLSELRAEFRRSLRFCCSLELVGLATLILTIDYFTIALLLYAFKLTLPMEAPLLLWVFLSAGSALPSAPGYVGIYQVAAVWGLSIYLIPAATAVALATVLQVTTLGVALLIVGLGELSLIRLEIK